MTNTAPGIYRSLSLIKSHMQISVGSFYVLWPNRLLLYFVLGGILVLEGVFALAVYKGPSILISHMAFVTVYALHTALTYTLCQLVTDTLACRVMPRWGGYFNRTVGKQWLIWFSGFVLAFIFHRTMVLCLVHIYAPDVAAYYTRPRNIRPHHGEVLLYTLPFWSSGVFITVSFIIRVQGKLFAGNINSVPKNVDASDSLRVTANNRLYQIAYADLSHITVEDHYSRIFFDMGDHLQNIFIRTPLAELQQTLPDNRFFRIHRSHLVNLGHVAGVSKSRRELTIRGIKDGSTLPISRYRISELCNKIKCYPSSNTNGS